MNKQPCPKAGCGKTACPDLWEPQGLIPGATRPAKRHTGTSSRALRGLARSSPRGTLLLGWDLWLGKVFKHPDFVEHSARIGVEKAVGDDADLGIGEIDPRILGRMAGREG